MFRDEAILGRTKRGHYKVIHNHNTSNLHDTPTMFNTTKRLPGTTEFVNKIRPKVVK